MNVKLFHKIIQQKDYLRTCHCTIILWLSIRDNVVSATTLNWDMGNFILSCYFEEIRNRIWLIPYMHIYLWVANHSVTGLWWQFWESSSRVHVSIELIYPRNSWILLIFFSCAYVHLNHLENWAEMNFFRKLNSFKDTVRNWQKVFSHGENSLTSSLAEFYESRNAGLTFKWSYFTIGCIST